MEQLQELKLKARAKINISLDVLGKRPDGYHEVRMIMQQIDLYDEIVIQEIQQGIRVRSNLDFLPCDEGNLAYRAARLMQQTYGINKGVEIFIQKQIPVAAGLAGGSTDAAAVLTGLNQLWNIGASKQELMNVGLKLGADVPFCILGGAALAEGIGEKLTAIDGLENVWIVLSKPNLGVSTAEVYKNLELEKIEKHPDTEAIMEAMKNNQLQKVASNLCNVLESVTENLCPIVKDIKRRMLEYQALGSLMSGSGPTVFGIYKDYQKAKNAYDNLSKVYKQTFVVKTYSEVEEL
ncbi:MAG: 4-(cytidine 5'-diphospho)-2-C-methyl-D-erythritol kinase [Bacillota bacterium]